MSMQNTQILPEGMNSITPHLICANAIEAIEFYKRAFNAVEKIRLLGPGGTLIHANLRIGNSSIMLAEENMNGGLGPKSLNGSPVFIHLQVTDVDNIVAQAVAAGATIKMPVADMFWGDRYGQLEDPFGHRWSVATRIRDLSPAEMQEATTKMFCTQQI